MVAHSPASSDARSFSKIPNVWEFYHSLSWIARILEQSTANMKVLLENEVGGQLALLAEGQQTIIETMPKESRIKALEDKVEFLESIARAHQKEMRN